MRIQAQIQTKSLKLSRGGGNCAYKDTKNAFDSVESFDSKDSFDSLDSHNHSSESTHPLTPSAREGECVDSPNPKNSHDSKVFHTTPNSSLTHYI